MLSITGCSGAGAGSHPAKEAYGRRPNYGFEKRQKEIDKLKKKEAKAEKKEQRKREAEAGEGEIPQGDEDLDGTEDEDG